jgi:hypothetical protein
MWESYGTSQEDCAMNPLARVIEWLDSLLEELVSSEPGEPACLEDAVNAARCVVAILIRNARLISREEEKHGRAIQSGHGSVRAQLLKEKHRALLKALEVERAEVDQSLDLAQRSLARLEASLLEARQRERLSAARREVAQV